jgi:hypothetical protein
MLMTPARSFCELIEKLPQASRDADTSRGRAKGTNPACKQQPDQE